MYEPDTPSIRVSYCMNKTYGVFRHVCEQWQYRQYETCPEAQTCLLRVQPLTPELTYRAQKSKKIEKLQTFVQYGEMCTIQVCDLGASSKRTRNNGNFDDEM